ncbi:MAG: nucleotidyltransferase domain-containing protein [Planctomycetota bacterium]
MNEINAKAIECGRNALVPGRIAETLPKYLFVTISGAHLYGFPSKDSDIDLRGCHVLPINDVIGLKDVEETFQSTSAIVDGMEVDCVSHDLRKYLKILIKNGGYVLEQILSPLVVYDCGHLTELRELTHGAITKHVVHHYKGFFHGQEKLVMKDPLPTAKAVLYLFRVVMTGLHLLRTKNVETNILKLNEIFELPFIPELVARKVSGTEKGRLEAHEFANLMDEAKRLEAQLDPASEVSPLPDVVTNYAALDDFLKRMRVEFSKA